MPLKPQSTLRLALIAVVCLLGSAYGWAVDEIPARLAGVSVDEHLGEDVPLDVQFMDDRGGTTSLRELLKDDKPVLLTLNYSDCPGLCIAQLNGLVRGINDVGSLHLNKDFKMVSLSIDPKESRERAAATKEKYADSLADHHEVAGWSFWVGSEKNIQQIAKAVGFNYTYDPKHKQYNHAATAILISPKGRITRYLYEVGYTGDTLKMALVEAGEGRIGTTLDAFVLWCSHYDANENRYSASAKTILSVTAGLFLFVGLIASIPFWIPKRRASETIGHTAPASPSTTIHETTHSS